MATLPRKGADAPAADRDIGGTAGAARTPDGRYLVVRGRLWRCGDPRIPPAERERLVRALMDARRLIGRIKRGGAGDLAAARRAVDAAKVALGERGPVWWSDGAPDYTRRMARTTPYADWHAHLARD